MAKRYGWLKNFYDRWGRASGGGELAYHYGYPAYGAFEPNVVLQYLFDEASGNIVDEVAGITLIPDTSPTYNVTASAPFAGLSPGITYARTGTVRHKKNPSTDIVIGTSDFTIEIWFKTTASGTGSNYIFYHYDGVGGGVSGFFNTTTNAWRWSVMADDLTTVSSNIALPAGYNDGNIHKIRAVFTRSGNSVSYMDGVSFGTVSIASLAGKTISLTALVFSGQVSASSLGFLGTLFEFRLSLNASNNSSGPNGG